MTNLKDANELESQLSSSVKLESAELESAEEVECPVAGNISRQECLKHQARPLRMATVNPFYSRLYRACRDSCPNSSIGINDASVEKDADVHQDNDGFLSRLMGLIEEEYYGNESQFARASGLSNSGLKRYLAGGDPSRKKLIAIAKANNVNLLWLATGEGPKHPEARAGPPCESAGYVEVERLQQAVEAVEIIGRNAPAERKARAIALVYERLIATQGQAEMIETMRLIQAILADTPSIKESKEGKNVDS